MALSGYIWNLNLNLAIAKHCKKIKPNLKIIMGGPNFKYEDPQWVESFFTANPFIDIFIVREGENSFLKCIELLEKNKFDLTKSDYSKWPSTFYGFDFPSVVNVGNIYGVQFHPEKSHSNGLNLFSNFANL